MFQYASPNAPNLMGGHAPPFQGGFAPSRVGAMVPVQKPSTMGYAGYRSYDIVGQEPASTSTWQKVKDWGNKDTFGVANKWLALTAAGLGVVWYGYFKGWFGR